MRVILVLVFVFSSGRVVFGEIPEFLQRFQQDPFSVSKEIPDKRGASRLPLFDAKTIESRDFISAKDNFRQKILCRQSLPGEPCRDEFQFFPAAAFNEDWQLKAFIGSAYEKNLMKLKLYQEGHVPTIPWSGHYWPVYEGGIGARFGDPRFPHSESFSVNYNYFKKKYLKNPGRELEHLGQLSPAEKYDYLLGDREWSLTRTVWTEGKAYMDSTGKVETWMGICHGWAPASMSVPEPTKAFDVSLPRNQGTLRIYPHDLKGLISQLWAQANFSYDFLGGRCNDKNPPSDENGRIISEDCFDINPSTWHLALVHRVGRDRQSFVLDATYDYEVWNQPIASYKLKYFNPANHLEGALESSLIPYSELKEDPYRKYRSTNVKFIIGVISEIHYVVEEPPDQNDSIGNPLNRLVTVSYYYDLELDQEYNLIGGEWYQQAHPDMLWRPSKNAIVEMPGEQGLSPWEGALPMPEDYFKLGTAASAQKMPLARILNKLVEWSLGQR